MSGAGVAAMQSRCSMSEIIGRTVRPVGMQVMDELWGVFTAAEAWCSVQHGMRWTLDRRELS